MMKIKRISRNGTEVYAALMEKEDLEVIVEATRVWLLMAEVQERTEAKKGDPDLKPGETYPLFRKEVN